MNCAYEWYWMELQTWLQQGVPPTNAAWKEVVSRLEAASKMTVRGLGTVDGKCWEDPVQETLIVLLKLGRARFDPKKGTVSDFVFGILRKQIITHLFRPATKTAKRAVPFDESVGAFLEQKPIVTEGATDSDQSMDLNTLLPGIGHDPDAKRLAEAATTVDSREADIQISLRTGISRWKVRQIRKRMTAFEVNSDSDAIAIAEAAKTADSRGVDIQLSEKTGFSRKQVRAIKKRMKRLHTKQLRMRGKLRIRGNTF